MPTLFVLSRAPHTDPNEVHKLTFARADDAVILIEDAVYGVATTQNPLAAALAKAVERGLKAYVLAPDLAARGIETDLPTVDYAGFVELLAEHDRSVH